MFTHKIRNLAALVAVAVIASCGLTPGARSLLDTEGPLVTFSYPDQLVAVEMAYRDRSQINALANAGVDIWSVDKPHKQIKAALNQAQYHQAVALGLKIMPRSDRFLRNNFDPGYHTYETMLPELQQVTAQNPGLCRLVDLGPSWATIKGKANRHLWAVHFDKAGTGKPVVLFAACHHAREIVTPEMVLGMVHYLADNYGKDAEVTADVDNRDIWLVPMVNPDGHALAAQGVSQRKNGNNVTGGKQCVGVDLNRNYDASWGTAGDSGDPESEVFRGTKAFSEPETQEMSALEAQIKPTFLLTFHSFSNSVMWSWDKSDAPPPDKRLAPIGRALGKLSGYQAYQGSQMYINSGDDVDWTFEHLHTLSYTVEIGSQDDGFDPPYARVAQFWDQNRPMMLYCLKIADNPNRVFGPELSAPSLVGGRLSVGSKGATRRIEYFVGRPGQAGTGTPMTLDGAQGLASTYPSAERQVVYVHAQGPSGMWGPWQTVWNR